MKRLLGAAVLVLVLLLFAALAWLWPEPEVPPPAQATPTPALPEQIARGAYLARAGNCQACHTARGGAPYAGGRAIPTPFGTFYTPNITPEPETGIGRWTAEEFYRALHEGRSRDGRPLYPAFPYTNYTRITRADSDALFAHLRAVPAVRNAAQPHELRFPYRYRPLLAGWRLLYFRPGTYEPEPSRGPQWNRGAYLVQGLGHCSACHESRNALGAIRSRDNPAGGLVLNWYAPSLHASSEAGVQGQPVAAVARLLGTGVSDHASLLGPMAEVTYESLQHLSASDLEAMALYLSTLPNGGAPTAAAAADLKDRGERERFEAGALIYERDCAGCHGAQGEGRPPAAPALAGNRALRMASTVNPIRVVLFGGYPPGTAGNPRPFGMPPFGHHLSDEEIAAVLSYTRGAWNNGAGPVHAYEVARQRGSPLW